MVSNTTTEGEHRIGAPQPEPQTNLESNPIHQECTQVTLDPLPMPVRAQTGRTLPAASPTPEGKAKASPDPPHINNGPAPPFWGTTRGISDLHTQGFGWPLFYSGLKGPLAPVGLPLYFCTTDLCQALAFHEESGSLLAGLLQFQYLSS